MASQPEAVRFPFPPSPVPHDTGPELRALATRQPVTRVELPDGSAAWLVTGFDEVREVLIDRRFSRALVHQPDRVQRGVEAILDDSMISMDPPEHSRLRKLVAGAFPEKRMQALRPEVARIVDDLLAQLAASPRPADLIRSFSLPLPSSVICSLLGVPPADVSLFYGWSNTLFSDWSRDLDEIEKAHAAISAIWLASSRASGGGRGSPGCGGVLPGGGDQPDRRANRCTHSADLRSRHAAQHLPDPTRRRADCLR